MRIPNIVFISVSVAIIVVGIFNILLDMVSSGSSIENIMGVVIGLAMAYFLVYTTFKIKKK